MYIRLLDGGFKTLIEIVAWLLKNKAVLEGPARQEMLYKGMACFAIYLS